MNYLNYNIGVIKAEGKEDGSIDNSLLAKWEAFLKQYLGAESHAAHSVHMDNMAERVRDDTEWLESLITTDKAKRYVSDLQNGELGKYSDEEFIDSFETMAPIWGRYAHPLSKFILMDEMMKRVNGAENILDVGCGNALYTTFMKREGRLKADVFGIDPSPTMIRRAYEIAIAENIQANFQVGFAQDMRFENESFDLVFSIDALHWSMQWRRIIRKMAHVLRNDGQLFIAYTIQPGFRSEPLSGEIMQILASEGVDVDQFSPVCDDKENLAKMIIGGVKRKESGRIIIPKKISY